MPVASGEEITIPSFVFPEMMLRAPALVPPMVLKLAPSIEMPLAMLPWRLVPVMSTPTKLPCIKLPIELVVKYTPASLLPEMMLRAAVLVLFLALFLVQSLFYPGRRTPLFSIGPAVVWARNCMPTRIWSTPEKLFRATARTSFGSCCPNAC